MQLARGRGAARRARPGRRAGRDPGRRSPRGPERERLRRLDVAAIVGERAERVEVADSGIRVLRRDRATTDVPGRSTTTASPTRMRRPIQASSACGSSPSTPKFMRNAADRPRLDAEHAARSRRASPSPRSVAAPPRPRSGAGRSGSTSRTGSPATSDSALVPRPGHEPGRLRRAVERRHDLGAPGSTVAESSSTVRERETSAAARPRRSVRARVCSGPWPLSLTSRSLSSTRKNRRSPRSPDLERARPRRPASSASALTGVSEIHETRGQSLRQR